MSRTVEASAAGAADEETHSPSLPPLRLGVSVPLPPAEAFDLFTRDLASWWPLATHSVAGERAATCAFEGGVGGQLVEVADDGARHVWGTIVAWERPARLALTWHPGREAASAQEVELRFEAEPGGCRVELVHRGWEALGADAQATRERYADGWQHVLGSVFRRAAEAPRRRPGRGGTAALALLLLLATAPHAGAAERAIELSIEVDAPIAAVWRSWTTRDGIREFFAPDANVELEVGGAYEMLFDPDAPPGLRGGEGNRILAIDPPHLLSFTWNAPPSLPEVRPQRTHVTVRLSELADDRTRVTLRHDGWGDGGQWDDAFTYFQRAWGEAVLPRLRQRHSEGPLAWPARENEQTGGSSEGAPSR
jgi:uncharacterized protein YndB with AHSA1/START domain